MSTNGFVLFLSFFIFSSCSLFLTNRSFIDEMEKDTDGPFVPGKDFPIVAGDSGKAYRTQREVIERTPLNKRDEMRLQRQAALENELQALEESLSNTEYQHYLRYYDYLSDISEKIYFLNLKNIEERNFYLRGKGASNPSHGNKFEDEMAIRGKDIYIGMSKNAVMKSWGRPLRVDVAGNPVNQNERWMFYDNGKTKYVFFESGEVHGWLQE